MAWGEQSELGVSNRGRKGREQRGGEEKGEGEEEEGRGGRERGRRDGRKGEEEEERGEEGQERKQRLICALEPRASMFQ